MNQMNPKYLGSDFDDFLLEVGLLDEVETVASRRVCAYQVSQAMNQRDPAEPCSVLDSVDSRPQDPPARRPDLQGHSPSTPRTFARR